MRGRRARRRWHASGEASRANRSLLDGGLAFPADESGDEGDEGVAVDRFRGDGVPAGTHKSGLFLGAVMGGEGDDGAGVTGGANAIHGFEAIHARHVDVQKNEVELLVAGLGALDRAYRLGAVGDGGDGGAAAAEVFFDEPADIGVVFREKDATVHLGVHLKKWACGLDESRRGEHRYFEPEVAAAPGLAGDFEGAAHLIDEFPGDREPETRAAVMPAFGLINLIERLEYSFELLAGDADARVDDIELQPERLWCASRCGLMNDERDAAGVGEFDGVAEEVEEYLPQTHAIGADHFGKRVAEFEIQRQVLGRGARTQQFEGLFGDLGGRVVIKREAEIAGLDPGEVEEVVDHAEQMGRVLAEDGEVLGALFAVEADIEEQIGITENACERRADFMGGVGKEDALGVAGLLGDFRRAAELGFDFLTLFHFMLQAAVEGGEVGGTLLYTVFEKRAILLERFFGAKTVGDVECHDEASGGIFELNGVADDFDAEEFAVFLFMGDGPGVLHGLGEIGESPHQFGDAFLWAKLGDRKSEKFFAAESIGGKRLIIGGENAEGFGIKDPHGKRVASEEELVVTRNARQGSAGAQLVDEH